jgi:hypothetical protein
VDDGSRLTAAAWHRCGENPGNRSGKEVLEFFLQKWIPYYGRPVYLRMDSEGCHKEGAFQQWLQSRGVLQQMTAGEAHDQNAVAETHIGLFKATMTKAAELLPESVTAGMILREAVAAISDLGRYHGVSPFSSMLGRTPEPELSGIFGHEADLSNLNAQLEDDVAAAAAQVRLACRKAFLEADASRKLIAQQLRKNRKGDTFEVGDLVYFWRRGKGKHSRPGSRGAWCGPA